MATSHQELFASLAAPFDANEVKVRLAPGGRQLHYITARTAMNRLDEVLGPENWKDHYIPGEKSVVCVLAIRIADEWLPKEDAGGYAGMADQGDDDKSGFSDAFKRASAKFGVGRYLYNDGVPDFAQADHQAPQQQHQQQRPQGNNGGGYSQGQQSSQRPQGNGSQGGNGHQNGGGVVGQQGGGQRQFDGPPRSGKGMFSWCKDMEQKHEVGLLKYLNGWAKLQEFPGRMVDWDAEQIALAYAEGMRKIQSIQPGLDEALEEALSH